jgi:hypothetical protein
MSEPSKALRQPEDQKNGVSDIASQFIISDYSVYMKRNF